jgi:hypothetical protein
MSTIRPSLQLRSQRYTLLPNLLSGELSMAELEHATRKAVQ